VAVRAQPIESDPMRFYVGLHQPSDAKHLPRAFISANRLIRRRRTLGCPNWIMDSGAFTEISTHGHYRSSVESYARLINRWSFYSAGLDAAVSQDFMCEPFILERTGLTVEQHQQLTIERYDALKQLVRSAYLMPVLQGYAATDYVAHIGMYGDRLEADSWVGIGSICKRNTSVAEVEGIVMAIRTRRPDLRLHGFGLKTTALYSALVRDALYSADSMAWSFAARRQGRNRNDWREACKFAQRIERMPVQLNLLSLI
jgi:hypothetical protein